MKYTQKEYEEILKPQAKEIEGFIRKEIQPYLSEGVKITFGDIVKRGRFGEIIEHEFTLYVRKDEIFGSCGGLTIFFEIPEWRKGSCGSIDVYDSLTYGGKFIFDMCLNWNSLIKRKLEEAARSQSRSRNAVLNEFHI